MLKNLELGPRRNRPLMANTGGVSVVRFEGAKSRNSNSRKNRDGAPGIFQQFQIQRPGQPLYLGRCVLKSSVSLKK